MRTPEAPASAPAGPFDRWYTTAVLFILMAVSMADRQVISILAGPIKRHFALGDFAISLLIGPAFAVFYVLFAAPFGWATDRYPRNRVAAVAVALWSLAAMGSGLASSFALLLVARALVGAGEAGLAPAGATLLSGKFARGRLALPTALQMIGIPIGAAIGVVAGGAILASPHALPTPLEGLERWQAAFVLVGAPGLVGALLALTLRDARKRAAMPLSSGSPRAFVTEHAAMLGALWIGIGLTGLALQGIPTWAPEYMRRAFGSDPLTVGKTVGMTTLAAALVGQVLGSLAIDWTVRRHGLGAALRGYGLAILVLLPIVIAMFRMQAVLPFLIGLFVVMAMLLPSLPLGAMATQLLSPPPLRGRMAGLFLTVSSVVTFAVGPMAVGGLSQYVTGEAHLGIALAVTTIAAIAGATPLLLLAARRIERAAHQEPMAQ